MLNTKLTNLIKFESIAFTYKSGFSNCDTNWKTEFCKKGNQITIKINVKCNVAIQANKKTTVLIVQLGSNCVKDLTFSAFSGGLDTGSNVARCTLYADGTLDIISPTLITANTWIQGTLTTLCN